MGQFRRRMQRLATIDDISFVASPGLTKTDVNNTGLHTSDGVSAYDQPFGFWTEVDQAGYLVSNDPDDPQAWFGEYYTGIPANYTPQICTSRVQRSEILIDYQITQGVSIGSQFLDINAFNPQVGGLAGIYDFRVGNCWDGPGIFNLAEVSIPLGACAGAFQREGDATCNKIKISAVRVNSGRKDFTISWYQRADWFMMGAAVHTVTLSHVLAGAGDIPLMWAFNVNYPVNNNGIIVKCFKTSCNPIPYGNPPV